MPKKKPRKLTWEPLDSHDLIDNCILAYEKTATCCGVMEIGEFALSREGTPTLVKNFGLEVRSKETKEQPKDGLYGWGYYYNDEPLETRPATYEEVLAALKGLEKDWAKTAGMGVLWFRPEQQKGDWARLFKDLGWKDQGSFWNPNTRRTLNMWTKTFRKSAPRKKKTSKSVLNRS